MSSKKPVQIIEEFADEEFVASVENLIQSSDIGILLGAAQKIARTFGSAEDYFSASEIPSETEQRLVGSFHKNLMLLIQKTWVEAYDEPTKQQVLYQLEQFCADYQKQAFEKAYAHLRSIIADAVELMFGTQTKSSDFCEYALRVDPEFGIFWWYISNLPKNVAWPSEKLRCVIILGMIFLANY